MLKDEGVTRRIGCFGGKKGTWMVAPVAERVEVVGGMPTVVETVPIALDIEIYQLTHTAAGVFTSIRALLDESGHCPVSTHRDVNQCNAGPEIRCRIILVHEGVLPKVPYHKTDTHLHQGKDEHENGGLEIAQRH